MSDRIHPQERSTMTVVVFRTGQLGDTLVSLPAMWAIRAKHPTARLVLMTSRHPGQGFVSSWDVVAPTNLFSKVVYYNPERWRIGFIADLIRVIVLMRLLAPTFIYHLSPATRSEGQSRRDRFFFRRVCGIPHCHGLDASDCRQPQDAGGPLAPAESEVLRLLRVAGSNGECLKDAGELFRLPLGADTARRIDALWREAGLGPSTVALGLGSKVPAKRWPLERYVEVGRRLVRDDPQRSLIVLGGPEDRIRGNRLQAMLGPRVVNWAGALTVIESAEVLRRCAMYLGNDTGTMHLAAAAGIPAVAIFAARDRPGRWDPFGQGHTVLRLEVPCAGCMLSTCHDQDMQCLMGIHVPEVHDACRRTLETVAIAAS
jgi:heptosyltransferase-3